MIVLVDLQQVKEENRGAGRRRLPSRQSSASSLSAPFSSFRFRFSTSIGLMPSTNSFRPAPKQSDEHNGAEYSEQPTYYVKETRHISS
jgi:hypothetical protein